MGEATIVSMLSHELVVKIASMIPPQFIIPPAEDNDFVIVHIPDCEAIHYLNEGNTLRRIVPADQVAGSIVKDHINSTYGITDDAFPPMKSLPGKHSKKSITESFSEELKGLKEVRNRWYAIQVKMADDIWSNPHIGRKAQSITNIQRDACRALGLNREWLNLHRTDNVKCPACTEFIPGEALVCPKCHTVINQSEYDKKFKKAV